MTWAWEFMLGAVNPTFSEPSLLSAAPLMRATSEVEQAVCIVMAEPVRFSL